MRRRLVAVGLFLSNSLVRLLLAPERIQVAPLAARVMRARNAAAWIVWLATSLVTLPALGQTVGPLTNTTVNNARLIVPDGSSLRQSISTGETRWFVFGAEPGKTYVVEAVDPDSDLGSDTIGAMNVYAANGTTTPPAETNVNCTAGTLPPAVEVGVNGVRCVVRTFPPTPGNTQNARGIYIGVGSVTGPSFNIRVRESTIYGRWTTNSYDFHTELENTTAQTVCAEIQFLPNSGDSYAGTWSGGLVTQTLTIPPFGANKYVLPSGTLVGAANDKRGTLRIGACANPVNLVPGALHVSTYAYNPTTGGFLYFFATPANNGAASNSWSAASGGGSGTVTSVATGPGLTGGPITTTGTINLEATNLLPTIACAVNQIPKWNGSAWACQNDANSGGTVTSVATGTGLTGGPITGSGTINLAGTQLLPTVACAMNQIPKWNGSAWACAVDNGTNAFVQGGNAFGATAVLGTTDNHPLTIQVNGQSIMRYVPIALSPNIIGGHSSNSVNAAQYGQTIAGGGLTGSTCYEPSSGTYTRSCANQTLSDFATISGGSANLATTNGTVSGGDSNTASGGASTVAGGDWNTASGQDSSVGGGQLNIASGNWSTASGGYRNIASGDLSFAAGSQAIAAAQGMFAWADSQPFTFDFVTYRSPASSNDTFNVRATGGVVFVTGIQPNGWPAWECYTYSGAGWICSSDRNLKRNLIELDGSQILEKVVAMPIYQWQPKDGPNAELKHIGPMAQDFYAAFRLGDSDKAIGMQDAEGVALAAIQGLYAELKERDATIAAQQARIARDESRFADEEREIAELREQLSQVESLRGELAALRNAIAAATRSTAIAAQADATTP